MASENQLSIDIKCLDRDQEFGAYFDTGRLVQRATHRFLGHTEDVAGRSPYYHLSNEWG